MTIIIENHKPGMPTDDEKNKNDARCKWFLVAKHKLFLNEKGYAVKHYYVPTDSMVWTYGDEWWSCESDIKKPPIKIDGLDCMDIEWVRENCRKYERVLK